MSASAPAGAAPAAAASSWAASIVGQLRGAFNDGLTRPYSWRISQLQALERMVEENLEVFLEAGHQDLRKPAFEMMLSETGRTVSACQLLRRNLATWMAPQKVSASLLVKPGVAEIVPEPYGVILIIAPWNYPLGLLFEPLAGAIAAGNAVLLKPSEVSAAVSSAIARLVPKYLDPQCIRVVEGGVTETTAILEQRFDKIMYTGSTTVGRIVALAAARHLTPVTLELGGKCPVLVDATANLKVAARRIVFGGYYNAGQTCVAPDYVLAQRSIADQLEAELRSCIVEFYGDESEESGDLSRVINDRQFDRLTALLAEPGVRERIVQGGKNDKATRFISPTLVRNPPLDSALMRDEIFGPIIAVVEVDDMDAAIQFVNAREKPLAVYVFSERADVADKVITQTSSGGVAINETVLMFAVDTLPFGGVGQSGMGAYHGRFSFDEFVHKKGVLRSKTWPDLGMRYPPFSNFKKQLLGNVFRGNVWGILMLLLGFQK